ncbi:sensor histidine kinase [Intrasporangium sp. YIM S08009]|uniref:sensor histidine kinase n=1 Tax=Intrasporangium zincisolvens TaxID=3080018 RepID=UPI002B05BD73|nr:histidine kinase [Intrasporangium sp. YIM S08009]
MREGSVYDWLQRRPLLLDVPLALFFGGVGTIVLGSSSSSAAWALLGLPNLALVVRRRRPPLAFGVVSVGLALRTIPESNILFGDLAFLVALYSLAAYERRRRVRWAGLGVAALGAAIAALRFTGEVDRSPDLVAVVFTFVACATAALSAYTLGDLKRARLQRLADLQDRAERVEREREQELRLAAQQERAAIAREMHDVVAHALSVIVVQADGAAYAATRRPDGALEQAVRTLETVAATARDALGETRRLVGVLRDPESGAELAPTGGLDQLDDLVAGVRAAGVPVTLSVRGTDASRPVALDLAAYRVVQEGLTNVIKHAGPGAQAVVDVVQQDGRLRVCVSDDGVGAGSPDDGRGHGLAGMRERVAVHDGTLTAGPRGVRGFEVLATMPLPARPAVDPAVDRTVDPTVPVTTTPTRAVPTDGPERVDERTR